MAEEKKNDRKAFLWAIIDAFKCRYILFMIIDAIIAIWAYNMGASDSGSLIRIAAVLLLGFVFLTGQYLYLNGRGFGVKDIKRNERSADPRLMNSFDDAAGISMITGAVTAVFMLLSDLYISHDCIFGDAFFIPDAASRLAETAACAATVLMISSKNTLRRDFYVILSRSFCATDSELAKKSGYAVKCPVLMKRVRAMMTVRFTAVIVMTLMTLMCVLSTGGIPFNSVYYAVVCFMMILLTNICGQKDDKRQEERLTVWTSKAKSICVINVVAVTLIGFLFAFSFPTQSVYINYNKAPVYDYEEEVSYDIKPFDAPLVCDETQPLFTGLMIFTVVSLIIVYASSITEREDVKNSFSNLGKYLSSVLALVFAGVVMFGLGLYFKEYSIEVVKAIVAVSVGCVTMVVNAFAGLVRNMGVSDEK